MLGGSWKSTVAIIWSSSFFCATERLSCSRLCMSCTRQNSIAATVNVQKYAAGSAIGDTAEPRLSLLRTGRVELCIGEHIMERLGPGDFFCESTVLFDIPCLFSATAAKDTTLYHIPAKALAEVPIIRWKLLEVYETRLDSAVSLDVLGEPMAWQEEYSTGVAAMAANEKCRLPKQTSRIQVKEKGQEWNSRNSLRKRRKCWKTPMN